MTVINEKSKYQVNEIRKEILQLENSESYDISKDLKKKIVGYLNTHFGLKQNNYSFKPNQFSDKPALGLLETTTPKNNSIVWLYELYVHFSIYRTPLDISNNYLF